MNKMFLFLFVLLMSSQITQTQTQTTHLTLDTLMPIQQKQIPIVQTDGFMEAVAFKESRGITDTINKYGMLGKYQFSRATLNGLGYTHVSDTTFLKSEPLQDEAMIRLIKHNHKILAKLITKYNGDTIKGIQVTHSGIIAAAHLAGPSNVKKWLRTNGVKTRKDGFGTSIETYMKKFANYKINI
jgi:hypothetical protein